MSSSSSASSGKGSKKGASGGGKEDGPKTGKKPGGLSPTARRQEKRRREKLELIRQQVDEGSLTIRQMTPEERAKYPPRPKGERKRKS